MEMKNAFVEYGVLVNSGEWSGKLSTTQCAKWPRTRPKRISAGRR
jgi:hypothetical protein